MAHKIYPKLMKNRDCAADAFLERLWRPWGPNGRPHGLSAPPFWVPFSNNNRKDAFKKTSKNRCEKKVEKRASGLVNPGEPGGPAGSGKSNKRPTERQQKEDNLKERSSERSMQRDQPRPFNTPRAPSGPERIYWVHVAPRVSGQVQHETPGTCRGLGGYWLPDHHFADSGFHFPDSGFHIPVSSLIFLASSDIFPNSRFII